MKWIGLLIFLMINYTVSAQSQRVVGNYVQSQLGEQFNGWFYFSANDSSGTELWKTQGDSAYFVKDFYLGYTYMFNAWTPNSGAPSAFTVYDGHLYFTIVDNATYLRRLVKMDANEVCTTITTTVNSNRIVGNLQVYNNKLYYFESGNNGTSLKSYDGTNHVTVHSIPNLTNLSYGASFFEFQSNLVFGYSDCNACNGYLYFYDGTTVTQGPQYFDNDYVVPPNNFSFDGGNLYYKKYELFQNDLYYIWKDSASNKIQHFDGTNIRNE